MTPTKRLADLVGRAATLRPDAVAVQAGEAADRNLTYGEWDRRSRRLAAGMQRLGLVRGDRVALLFDTDRWDDYAVAYAAVQRVPAVPVPLSADLPELELRRVLTHCRPSLVVAPPGVRCPQPGVALRAPADLEHDGRGTAPAGGERGEHAEMLYARGTLRPPVAIPRSHDALLNAAPVVRAGPGALLHTFAVGTPAGQRALLAAVHPVLRCVVALPSFDPYQVQAVLTTAAVGTLLLHAATAQALLAAAGVDLAASPLREVVLSGGPVAPALLARLAEGFAPASLRLLEPDESERSGRRADDSAQGEGATPATAVALAQEGMLWHECLTPGCQNLPGLARRYRGPLDVLALRRALDEIIDRHAALRTNFELRRGRPVQVVRDPHGVDLALHDLRALSPDEREAEVRRLIAEAGRRPFDLVSEPLFQPALLRLDADDHVLVLRAHHAVLDDWSVGVFRRELQARYRTHASGGDAPAPPEPALQFADFAERQRRRLEGEAGDGQLAYWRAELDGAPLVTQLPVDDPERAAGDPQPAGAPVVLKLPSQLVQRLRALARRERCTLFMTLLTAFAVLLQRYTGQADVLLSTVVANRNRRELEDLIGCFTKKVPLRLRVDEKATFLEALTRARAALLGALTNQDLPFEAVLKETLAAPAAAHGLLPHPAVVFQGVTPRHELVLPGVETTGFDTSATAARAHFAAGRQGEPATAAGTGDTNRPLDGAGTGAPLQPGPTAPTAKIERGSGEALPWGAGLYLGTFVILSVEESGDEVTFLARGAFHAPAVRDLLGAFHTLLDSVVADPTRPVSALAVLDAQGEVEVCRRARGPVRPLPDGTLRDRLAEQVSRHPHAVAVDAGPVRLTFAELDRRAARLAHRLRRLGVRPGRTVGLALAPSPALVTAALAVWKAGGAWLGVDASEDVARLKAILQRAGADVVVGDAVADFPLGVPIVQVEDADEDDVFVHDDRPAAGVDAGSVDAATAARPEEPAVVFVGSGRSTVDPGVVLDHRCVLNLLTGLRYAVPAAADGADGNERLRVRLDAAPTEDVFLRQFVALLDGHTLRVGDASTPRAAAAVAALRRGEIDVVDVGAGDLPGLLAAALADALAERRDEVEPILVVSSRGSLAPHLWQALRSLPRVNAHVLYGPPACAFAATARPVAASPRLTVGAPLANVTAAVLDRHLRPVPARAVGRLHLAGPSLGHALGSDSGELHEAGGADGDGVRLRATGQLARALPDGSIELLGDGGGQVDLRGYVVDAAAIQSVLAAYPGVREVTVDLQDDEAHGPRLAARIVADGPPPGLAELRAFLWSTLPGYACPSLAVTDPPAAGEDAQPWECVALAALWAQGRDEKHVDPHDSYWQRFSFLDVLAAARDIGVRVDLARVSRNRTLATLAADLAAARSSARSTAPGRSSNSTSGS